MYRNCTPENDDDDDDEMTDDEREEYENGRMESALDDAYFDDY